MRGGVDQWVKILWFVEITANGLYRALVDVGVAPAVGEGEKEEIVETEAQVRIYLSEGSLVFFSSKISFIVQGGF